MEKRNQTYYANKLGVSKGFFSKVLSGRRNFGPKLAFRVAKMAKSDAEVWLFSTDENVIERQKIIKSSQSPKG